MASSHSCLKDHISSMRSCTVLLYMSNSFKRSQNATGISSATSASSVPAACRRVLLFRLGLVVELTGLQSPIETLIGGPSGDGVRGTAEWGSMSEEGGLGPLSDPVSVSELLDPQSQSLVSWWWRDCIAGARTSRMQRIVSVWARCEVVSPRPDG